MDTEADQKQLVDDSRILGGLDQASFTYGGEYQN